MGRRPGLSTQSRIRLGDLVLRFGSYVEYGLGIETLDQVDSSAVRMFVVAPSVAGDPSVATMRLRRSAVRLFFRVAMREGSLASDPSSSLELPARCGIAARPLTDDEVMLCRSVAVPSLSSTREAAAWALAEATGRTSELPHITVADLDLAHRRVWLHGSTRFEPRWGDVTSWGAQQLTRHLETFDPAEPSRALIYRGDGSDASRQAAACRAISITLQRAGFRASPDVRPLSIVAWAGANIYRTTGRIDIVAERLGLRTLDATARLIALTSLETDR